MKLLHTSDWHLGAQLHEQSRLPEQACFLERLNTGRTDQGNEQPYFPAEVVVVHDAGGKPGLLVGAIPYLRDSDLRTSDTMESDDDRTAKLKGGFKAHYQCR